MKPIVFVLPKNERGKIKGKEIKIRKYNIIKYILFLQHICYKSYVV
jgi:hypothetical protein